MKNLSTRLYILIALCLSPFVMQAQSYDKLWDEVEKLQQKDLPKSTIQKVNAIYEKARSEKNMPQLMKAYFTRAAEQIKLTPDSAETEMARLKQWAEQESDAVTAALLNHLIGNSTMQRNEPDWEEALRTYRRSLKEKEILLNTSASDYAPMTESTTFSKIYFQDNLYDLLVRQTIARLLSNWQVCQEKDIQEWIVELYDSLIDNYRTKGNVAAALLSHEAKILFLHSRDVPLQSHLSNEQTEKSLKELIRLYEPYVEKAQATATNSSSVMADAIVDVYLKLSENLCEQQKQAEAMQVLLSTLQKYPKTSLKDALQKKREWIESPSLSMDIPVIYPSYSGRLVVNYKNVTEVKIETYRLKLNPASPELKEHPDRAALCKNHGKKISTEIFHLPATIDYQPHIEKLSYQLPEAGIYVLKATPKVPKGKSTYQLMYVSPYQCILIPDSDNRMEVITVDQLTGNPIPYAEVVEYTWNETTDRFSFSKRWKANGQGSVIIPTLDRGTQFINVRTSGNDFMKICPIHSYGSSRFSINKKEGWRLGTSLFTDRSLYRPGQTVHVSGLRYEQLGDSLHCIEGKSMKIILVDANGKEIAQKSATTDSFGVFAVDFSLPKQTLPGHFTIRTENKTISIRVENYKRPTFDVLFTPTSQTYTFGDALSVKGNVKTFAGAPVRLAKGTYQIERSEAWLWRSNGAKSIISSGSFTTDAEGEFKIEFTLEPPFNQQKMTRVPYYNYTVKATVTDGAGETQAGELTLPIGMQSIGINIQGLKNKLARENQEKIQFQVMNLSKQLVKKELTYQVFALNKRNPDLIQSNAEGKTNVEKEQLVYEGKAMSQQSFVPEGIYALPSGMYRLKASTRDDQGRLVSVTQEFILFSLAERRPPVETVQWFYQDGDNWKNNPTVSLYIGSSEKDVYLLMDVYTANKRIRSERLHLNNSIQKFDFQYHEAYGDGISISLAFLREGKLYTKQIKLERPKPEKELILKWETFRDELTPGQEEMWRLKITDHAGNPVKANLLATLYDASLDKLYAHQWRFRTYFDRRLPYVGARSLANLNRTRFYIDFPYLQNAYGYRLLEQDTYSQLLTFPIWNRMYHFHSRPLFSAAPNMAVKSARVSRNNVLMEEDFAVDIEETAATQVVFQEEQKQIIDFSSQGPVRKNFAETAFFYPTVRTDEKGEACLKFMLPDALTEWKFMGFAHTQDLDYGQLVDKVKSSKPFMVQPNLPRFVRVGDASSLAASLVNLSMETIRGKVRMELMNPTTQQVVFQQEQEFKVEEGETGMAQFNYKVTEEQDVLICRITADAGKFSDGEQHYLPVLTNKEWITETIPFQLNGQGDLDLSLKELFNRQSPTATGHRLTVELTANPNWYVLQALPVLGNPSHEDAISWAAAYYANSLARHTIRKHPRIREVFESWQAEGVTKETLWSQLEKNADLKNLLLEETPWLAEAQTEAEQKQRMALLFDWNGMEQRLQQAAKKLKDLQTPEGGWTWYQGMPASRYTTTQVMKWMARLKSMHVMLEPSLSPICQRGLKYLRQKAAEEYRQILDRENTAGHKQARKSRTSVRIQPSEQTIQYLYICAIDPQAAQLAEQQVNTFFINRLLDSSHGPSIYSRSSSIGQKAQMAVILQADGKTKEASTLLRSIKEYMVSTPEMGNYFDTFKAPYSWYSYRIPTHVAAMEAICRIQPDEPLLNGMKQWLLKQKQVQAWSTPIATADAIHAFLLTDKGAVQTTGKMRATIHTATMTTPDDGLGYTCKTLEGKEAKVKTVRVSKEGNGIGWGAIYAQCLEKMGSVKSHSSKELQIKREWVLNGKPIAEGTIVKAGDLLTVRLQVKADRDMDFICIKDQRAACMEPADQLSGYEWSKGLGFYRVNHDASTEFFIDKFPKGSYVIEYQVYINRPGRYQAGSASIQSVYAPEYAAHAKGTSLRVY